MSCWQLLWRTLISQMVMHKSLPLLQKIPPQLLLILLSHKGRLGTFGCFTCCMTPDIILIIVKMHIAHIALQIYQSRDAPHLVSRDTCNRGIVNSLSQLMIRPVLALKLRGSDLFHIYFPRLRILMIFRPNMFTQLPISSLPRRSILQLMHHQSSEVCSVHSI